MNAEQIEKCITDGNFIPIMNWINSRNDKFAKAIYASADQLGPILETLVRYRKALEEIRCQAPISAIGEIATEALNGEKE